MNKCRFIIIIALILLTFAFGYVIGNESDKIQLITDEELITKLDNIYLELSNSFVIEGYSQIINNHTSVIGVPDLIDGRQDLDYGLYNRSKKLMYKNPSNGNIIMLHLVANENRKTEWLGSLGYQPDVYNSQEGQFKASYDGKFSDTTIYQYSFNHSNIRYFITSISNELGEDGVQPLNEAAKFTNELFLFVEAIKDKNMPE